MTGNDAQTDPFGKYSRPEAQQPASQQPSSRPAESTATSSEPGLPQRQASELAHHDGADTELLAVDASTEATDAISVAEPQRHTTAAEDPIPADDHLNTTQPAEHHLVDSANAALPASSPGTEANASAHNDASDIPARHAYRVDEPAAKLFGEPPVTYPGDGIAYRSTPQHNDSATAPSATSTAGKQRQRLRLPSWHKSSKPSSQPTEKKPLYRRKGFRIGAACTVVLAAAAGIGIPWFIHHQNLERGNALAAEFTTEIANYRSTWNSENLAAVTAPSIAPILAAAQADFFDLTAENLQQLTSTCTQVATARTVEQQLRDATVPQLPADEGAKASQQYVQAQQQAAQFTSSRQNADAFLAQSDRYLSAQEELCQRLPAYVTLTQGLRTNLATTMKNTLVIENGGKIETDNPDASITCSNPNGCVNLFDPNTREAYAAAVETTYIGYFSGIANEFSKNCFLDDFAAVCQTAATELQKVADLYQDAVNYLRNNQPDTTTPGGQLYPEFSPKTEAAENAELSAYTAILAQWKNVEPSVNASFSSTGASLAAYLNASKAEADTTATALLSSQG